MGAVHHAGAGIGDCVQSLGAQVGVLELLCLADQVVVSGLYRRRFLCQGDPLPLPAPVWANAGMNNAMRKRDIATKRVLMFHPFSEAMD